MRKPTSHKQSSGKRDGKTVATAVPDIRPSEFCAVCFLILGKYEKRVQEGDKVAHLHCARWFSEPRAA